MPKVWKCNVYFSLKLDYILFTNKNENGEYVVSLKYPVYFPVMKECSVPETRRKLYIAFDKRCVCENTKIFEEVIELRAKVNISKEVILWLLAINFV